MTRETVFPFDCLTWPAVVAAPGAGLTSPLGGADWLPAEPVVRAAEVVAAAAAVAATEVEEDFGACAGLADRSCVCACCRLGGGACALGPAPSA